MHFTTRKSMVVSVIETSEISLLFSNHNIFKKLDQCLQINNGIEVCCLMFYLLF